MAVDAFWVRTADTPPVFRATALAGQRPQGVELSICQRTVCMAASATHTFSAQKKLVAQIGLFHLFNQRLVNLQWSIVTHAYAAYLHRSQSRQLGSLTRVNLG